MISFAFFLLPWQRFHYLLMILNPIAHIFKGLKVVVCKFDDLETMCLFPLIPSFGGAFSVLHIPDSHRRG